MPDIKEEIIKSLNADLQLEHAARVQYLAHAEQINGLYADPLIGRLKEIAGDEEKHEEEFRTMIGDYLGGVPAMTMAAAHPAKDIRGILEENLKAEKHAIEQYQQTYQMLIENKEKLPYVFESLEHDLRHIIMEEQEHITELNRIKES